ncbi:hypothetical protein ES703_122600 [subsurface metagenome]
MSGIFGRKGNALGLARLDRQRLQPERLPAVVEPVEQAEMMAVQAKHAGELGAVGQRQHDGAPGFDAEGRLWRVGQTCRHHPLRAAQGQVNTQRVLQIKLRRQPVRRQRRGRRQRRRARGRIARHDDETERARLLAFVQQYLEVRARRRRHVDEGVEPAARRQHQRAVAGEKRLGRLAVDRHDCHVGALQLQCDHGAPAAVDEAKPQAFVGSGCDIHCGFAVQRPESCCLVRVGPGHRSGPVGPQPPLLDQQHVFAIDADGFTLTDHHGPAPRRQGVLNRQHAHVAQEGAGMAQWNPDLFPARGSQQAAADERLERGSPVDPAPVEGHGDCQVIGKFDLRAFAAAEAQLRGLQHPDRRFRACGAQGQGAPARRNGDRRTLLGGASRAGRAGKMLLP